MARRNIQPIKATLLTALLCLSAAAQPQTITGKVVAIADGDTLTVLDASNKQHKIRLEGIDAPESKQDYGSRARRHDLHQLNRRPAVRHRQDFR